MRHSLCPLILLAATLAHAQSPARIGNPKAMISDAVWAGPTLYISGLTANPVTPADAAKGTPAVYGDTNAQAKDVFTKIQNLLKTQGLTMADVVYMRVNLVGDPAKGGKMDFAGMNAAYSQFFGTKEQPNKPARVTVQVAGLAAAGALVEIESVVYKSDR